MAATGRRRVINGSKCWNKSALCVCVWVCVCMCVRALGLAEISFSIGSISKFMSAVVGSVITQVEIKAQ